MGVSGGWQRFVSPFWLHNCAQMEAAWRRDGELPDDFLRRDGYYGFEATQCPETARSALATVQYHVALRSLLNRSWSSWGGLQTLDKLGLEQYPKLPFNVLYHLWELASLERLVAPPVPWSRIRTTLHWGGGYGSLVWVLRLLGVESSIVFDLPVVCRLQREFLEHHEVPCRLVEGPEPFRPGRVTLVPLELVEDYPLPPLDLFCSLHALSESTPEAHRYVLERDFFAARHVLLMLDPQHPEFPDGVPLVEQLARGTNLRHLAGRIRTRSQPDPDYLAAWGR